MKQRGVFVVARAASGAVLALGLSALLAGSALAASAPRTTSAAKPAARRHAAHARRPGNAPRLGMRAAIDPATGRLVSPGRVTDAPGTAPAQATTPPSAGLAPESATITPRIIRLANGADLVAVPPDQQEYEVVRLGKDGKLLRACVHGDPKAAVFHAKEDK